MKTPALLFLVSAVAAAARAGEDPIPSALPAERYAAMADQSPFALATAAAPVIAPQASFAANWFVGGIARIGETDFVTIKSRDAALQFSLFGSEINLEQGVSLASVNWSDVIGKSTVILKKGAEMAKLEFNEADLRGPSPAAVAPIVGSPPPGTLRKIAGAQPVPNVPALPTSVAPLPVVTPSQSIQQFPQNAAPPIPIRRRERVIPIPQ